MAHERAGRGKGDTLTKRWRWVIALVAVAAIGATATAAVGATRQWSGTVTDIVVKTSSDPWEATGATEMTPIDGAELSVTVDRPAILIIDFAASSKCDGTVRTKCPMRARVDGTRAEPGHMVFDSDLFRWATGGAQVDGDQFAARSFRWAKAVEPGEHTVHLEWQRSSAYSGGTFALQSWTLSVMTVEES